MKQEFLEAHQAGKEAWEAPGAGLFPEIFNWIEA